MTSLLGGDMRNPSSNEQDDQAGAKGQPRKPCSLPPNIVDTAGRSYAHDYIADHFALEHFPVGYRLESGQSFAGSLAFELGQRRRKELHLMLALHAFQ